MAYIDNTQTKKEIEDAIRGNSVSNLAPSKVSDNIQLVCNVNPKDYRKSNIVKNRSNTATGVIYTTPTDKDFYLTDFNICAASTTAGTNSLNINTIPFGETSVVVLGAVAIENSVAITAGSNTVSVSLKNPILLARNTAINATVSGTLSLGRTTIFGYTVEN